MGTGIAISVKSTAAGGANTTGSSTVNKPTGTADNDLLIAIQGMNDSGGTVGGTLSGPTGWTQINTSRSVDAGSNDINVAVWRKVASSEPASWTWTSTSDGTIISSTTAVLAITGYNTSAPINISPSYLGNIGGTSASCPSITTTVANALLLCALVNNGAASFTPASGMTEQVDFFPSGVSLAVTVDSLVLGAAGATGSKSISITSGGNNTDALSMAIAPATGLPPAVLLNQAVTRAAYF